MFQNKENEYRGNKHRPEEGIIKGLENERNLKISQIHIKKKTWHENIDRILRILTIGKGISATLIISILLISVASAVPIDRPTIAFISDGKPALGYNINLLIEDFNQIIPQSPTGYVNATVMIGDMNHVSTGSSNTDKAYAASTAKNVPAFFAVGNHDLENVVDVPAIRSKFNSYAYSPNPGPAGSRNTTYSFDIGNIHVVVLNIYWDGNANGVCDWHVPNGGLNTDDSCMKYSAGDGGFIPDALYNWLENDLSTNTKSWTIVVGHEPLYPWGTRHIGDSLDENKTNRDKLENLFISKKVTAFIGSHTHTSGIKTGISGIKNDNTIQSNAGVIGGNVGVEKGGDNFATIMYAYEDDVGNFVIEQKSENLTWATPRSTKLVRPKLTTPILGDVNNDGSITVEDALLYLRYSVGQDISPYSIDPVRDDVTCDNPPIVTVADALQVLRKSIDQSVHLGC